MVLQQNGHMPTLKFLAFVGSMWNMGPFIQLRMLSSILYAKVLRALRYDEFGST